MFIERHGLWSEEQRAQARELRKRLEREPLELVRVAWADPHGASRAKALSLPVFLDALENGYNINVATTTLDSAGGRLVKAFSPGGGPGVYEKSRAAQPLAGVGPINNPPPSLAAGLRCGQF